MLNFRDLLGTPFSNIKGKGFHCYSLVREVSGRVGKPLPEFDAILDRLERHHFIKALKDHEDWVELDGPEPYCVVTFRLKGPRVTHAGFVLEDGVRFIHIMRHRRVAVERLDILPWNRKVDGYFKYNPSHQG